MPVGDFPLRLVGVDSLSSAHGGPIDRDAENKYSWIVYPPGKSATDLERLSGESAQRHYSDLDWWDLIYIAVVDIDGGSTHSRVDALLLWQELDFARCELARRSRPHVPLAEAYCRIDPGKDWIGYFDIQGDRTAFWIGSIRPSNYYVAPTPTVIAALKAMCGDIAAAISEYENFAPMRAVVNLPRYRAMRRANPI